MSKKITGNAKATSEIPLIALASDSQLGCRGTLGCLEEVPGGFWISLQFVRISSQIIHNLLVGVP